MDLAMCPRGLPCPWLLAYWSVTFSNWFFFFFKGGYLGKSACLSLGSISMGAALTFAVCLWELPWPWLCALAMTAMPMGIALILVVCFCDGCFLIGVVMALGACT